MTLYRFKGCAVMTSLTAVLATAAVDEDHQAALQLYENGREDARDRVGATTA